MERIRKALIAGLGAGLSAGIGVLVNGGTGRDNLSLAVGSAVVAAAVTGWATWRVPNARG